MLPPLEIDKINKMMEQIQSRKKIVEINQRTTRHLWRSLCMFAISKHLKCNMKEISCSQISVIEYLPICY